MNDREEFAKQLIQGAASRGYSREEIAPKLESALKDWDTSHSAKPQTGIVDKVIGTLAKAQAGPLNLIPGVSENIDKGVPGITGFAIPAIKSAPEKIAEALQGASQSSSDYYERTKDQPLLERLPGAVGTALKGTGQIAAETFKPAAEAAAYMINPVANTVKGMLGRGALQSGLMATSRMDSPKDTPEAVISTALGTLLNPLIQMGGPKVLSGISKILGLNIAGKAGSKIPEIIEKTGESFPSSRGAITKGIMDYTKPLRDRVDALLADGSGMSMAQIKQKLIDEFANPAVSGDVKLAKETINTVIKDTEEILNKKIVAGTKATPVDPNIKVPTQATKGVPTKVTAPKTILLGDKTTGRLIASEYYDSIELNRVRGTGGGTGTKLLNELKNVSNETNKPIYLESVPVQDIDNPISQKALNGWYEKNGFVRVLPQEYLPNVSGKHLSTDNLYVYKPSGLKSVTKGVPEGGVTSQLEPLAQEAVPNTLLKQQAKESLKLIEEAINTGDVDAAKAIYETLDEGARQYLPSYEDILKPLDDNFLKEVNKDMTKNPRFGDYEGIINKMRSFLKFAGEKADKKSGELFRESIPSHIFGQSSDEVASALNMSENDFMSMLQEPVKEVKIGGRPVPTAKVHGFTPGEMKINEPAPAKGPSIPYSETDVSTQFPGVSNPTGQFEKTRPFEPEVPRNTLDELRQAFQKTQTPNDINLQMGASSRKLAESGLPKEVIAEYEKLLGLQGASAQIKGQFDPNKTKSAVEQAVSLLMKGGPVIGASAISPVAGVATLLKFILEQPEIGVPIINALMSKTAQKTLPQVTGRVGVPTIMNLINSITSGQKTTPK